MITLREITRDNYLECLRLKVAPEQEGFVASNAISLAQSKYHPETVPLAIYHDETMVGFIMYCIDSDDDSYWIWRLMVDARYQSKGYGTQAMKQVIERITADKSRNKVFISFEPENSNAERLYAGLGFVHTGEIMRGEAVMRLDY
jgi:diamine N-acetyltransferase